MNKCNFPATWAALDLLFTSNCIKRGTKDFVVNEFVYVIPLGKSVSHLLFMLPHSADEITRNSCVENRITRVCQYIYIVLFNGHTFRLPRR